MTPTTAPPGIVYRCTVQYTGVQYSVQVPGGRGLLPGGQPAPRHLAGGRPQQAGEQ